MERGRPPVDVAKRAFETVPRCLDEPLSPPVPSQPLRKSETNDNMKRSPLIFSHVLRALDKENNLCYYLDG